MKAIIAFLLWLLTLLSVNAQTQTVRLDYDDQSLDRILIDLNERFEVEVAANAQLTTACSITIHKQFQGIEAALTALASQCDLQFKKLSGVYIFLAKPQPSVENQVVVPPARIKSLFQGVVVEKGTGEPVPFTLVQLNKRGFTTDADGRFSFKSFADEERALFRCLGYAITDTVLQKSAQLRISLEPRLLELQQIQVVADRANIPLTNLGEKAGHIRFNDISNQPVPGLSDNVIFNNLRLYPGIMAAGESIEDFVIWGSYPGQNHVIYEGISLFNSWGINDDMGRVNPFMLKNVEVYKGGYNVPYGDRIGGVVLMEAITGNKEAFSGKINLTNQLANAYVNIPLFNKKAALQVAGRKTLFEGLDLSTEFEQDAQVIVPEYDYYDLNLKFTVALSANDRLELNGFYSADEYKGSLRTRVFANGTQDLSLSSTQSGGAIKYSRNWKGGGLSELSVSQSQYQPDYVTNFLRIRNQNINDEVLLQYNWTNRINESRIGFTHSLAIGTAHQLKAHVAYISLETALSSNVEDRVIQDATESLNRISFYLHDHFHVGSKLSFELGLKADVPEGVGKTYLQPRLNANYELTAHWQINAGWGKYNQFVSRNRVVDLLGNRSDVWQVANGDIRPVLEATHYVLGFGYKTNSFQAHFEGFYKESAGFGRFSVNRNDLARFESVDAQTTGFETLLKKEVSTHQFSLSYTYLQVLERFDNGFRTTEFSLAPQSQRHEIKSLSIFNWHPFQASMTHVFGSGFYARAQGNSENLGRYWRTDLAVQYAFSLQSYQAQVGVSLINLFNNRNVRLNQSVNNQNGARLNTVGIPFTPTVFFNMKF